MSIKENKNIVSKPERLNLEDKSLLVRIDIKKIEHYIEDRMTDVIITGVSDNEHIIDGTSGDRIRECCVNASVCNV